MWGNTCGIFFWSLYTALLAITWIFYLSWNLLTFPPICCKEVIRTITEMWEKKQHSIAPIASLAISKQLNPTRTGLWHFSGVCINRVRSYLVLRFSALLYHHPYIPEKEEAVLEKLKSNEEISRKVFFPLSFFSPFIRTHWLERY